MKKAQVQSIEIPAGTFGRKELLEAARRVGEFGDGQLRNLISNLLASGRIRRVGHGAYVAADGEDKPRYENSLSDTAAACRDIVERRFPLLDFRIWDLSSINEFLNHQLSSEITFVEVESDGCGFVFEELFGSLPGSMVLLKPGVDEVVRYGRERTVVVAALVSESPKPDSDPHGLALEKLVVDMFASRLLRGLLPAGDYPEAIGEMFMKYSISETALLRYARRRNKEEEVRSFIEEETTASLHRKGTA